MPTRVCGRTYKMFLCISKKLPYQKNYLGQWLWHYHIGNANDNTEKVNVIIYQHWNLRVYIVK